MLRKKGEVQGDRNNKSPVFLLLERRTVKRKRVEGSHLKHWKQRPKKRSKDAVEKKELLRSADKEETGLEFGQSRRARSRARRGVIGRWILIKEGRGGSGREVGRSTGRGGGQQALILIIVCRGIEGIIEPLGKDWVPYVISLRAGVAQRDGAD